MSKTVHKGDVGVTITVTITGSDLAGASAGVIHLYNPATQTATDFEATLSGSNLTYTTTSSSDLAEAGEHYVSATVTGAGGFSRTTNDRERIFVVEHPNG